MTSQSIPRVEPASAKKSVYVGMSGGVDSSVSAALLKRAGYDVTGVFIKVWQPEWLECTWREERRDAMRVAAHLGIPFVTLDLEKEYKKEVVDYMIDEYKAGRTPNPDVMCNKYVKFGGFYDWAVKNGADFVATGHYAKISQKGDSYFLEASDDPNKDQSYFLWTIRTEQLPQILFPIGDMEKPQVRDLAKKFRLPTAEKKDSQGLCFIGMVNMKEFLLHYLKTEEGDVLNTSGEVIGKHPGSLLFTIGERHGFTVTKKTPNDSPLFVVVKDVAKNTITVSDRVEDSETSKSVVKIDKTNWIGNVPKAGTKCMARSRYRQELQEVIIQNISGDKAEVRFLTNQGTITPGQSVVFYERHVCMGGGVIV